MDDRIIFLTCVLFDKLVHVFFLAIYFFYLDLIKFLTIDERYVLSSKVSQIENVPFFNYLFFVLFIVLFFLIGGFDITAFIYTVITLDTFHLDNNYMKHGDELFNFFNVENWIYTEISVLLGKVFFC